MRNRKVRADVNLQEALEGIRQRVGKNAATSYTKEGCRISMANLPSERVVLDVDLAFQRPAHQLKINAILFSFTSTHF